MRVLVLAICLAYATNARSAEPGDLAFPLTVELGSNASLYIQHGDYEKTYVEGDVVVVDFVDDTLFINDLPYSPRRPRRVPPDLGALRQEFGDVPFVQARVNPSTTPEGWLKVVKDWRGAQMALHQLASQTWGEMIDGGADVGEASDATVAVYEESSLTDSVTIAKQTQEALLVDVWWRGHRGRLPFPVPSWLFTVTPQQPLQHSTDPAIRFQWLLEWLLDLDKTRKEDRPARLELPDGQPHLYTGARALERAGGP